MKIKYKFSIILILSILITAIGITYTLSSNFLSDKRESIYENHTVAALHISEKLSQYFRLLRSEVENKNTSLRFKFPEVIAVKGDFTISSHHSETFMLNKGLLTWHLNGTSIQFEKGFLNRITALAPTSAIALLPMNQNKIIQISNEVQYPDSQLLEEVLTQQNTQAVVARFSREKEQDYLTVLAPIAGLSNTLLLMQTNQQDISQILRKALTDLAPFLIITIIIILIAAALFTGRITESLEKLSNATKEMAKGNWKLNLQVSSKDEVGQLVQSFNSLGGDLEARESELIEVNQKLNQAEKLASLGMFSAGIAHEVKNPLGAILGNAQLIKRKIQNEDALRYSDVIINESYRATHIIEDLLVFAKERELNLTTFALSEFTNEIKNALKPKLDEAHIMLDIKEQYSELKCDREQMIQVIQNIILNALDAFEGVERERKSIEVIFDKHEECQRISIKDNACGIPQESLSKIFEPFFSSKKIKKGTGLGMAICYGIIQKHQGEISVESTEGEGTVFTITLPA